MPITWIDLPKENASVPFGAPGSNARLALALVRGEECSACSFPLATAPGFVVLTLHPGLHHTDFSVLRFSSEAAAALSDVYAQYVRQLTSEEESTIRLAIVNGREVGDLGGVYEEGFGLVVPERLADAAKHAISAVLDDPRALVSE